MKPYALVLLLSLGVIPSIAQKKDLTRLFSTETPLEIKLRFSVKDVKKITNDTIYTASVLHYKDGDKWDSLKVSIRARGNYRRANCYFPPLRVKISKEDAKKTVFEGNRSLKLVLPCKSSKEVAENSEIVFLMVSDTPDVEQVLFGKNGVAEGLKPGTIVVDMSSISPIATKDFAKRIEAMGRFYVDSPVSGGEVGAKMLR